MVVSNIPTTQMQNKRSIIFLKETLVSEKSLSHVRLFVTPWTAWSTRLLCPWQEYWRGLLFPSPGDLPNPGIEPRSPVL